MVGDRHIGKPRHRRQWGRLARGYVRCLSQLLDAVDQRESALPHEVGLLAEHRRIELVRQMPRTPQAFGQKLDDVLGARMVFDVQIRYDTCISSPSSGIASQQGKSTQNILILVYPGHYFFEDFPWSVTEPVTDESSRRRQGFQGRLLCLCATPGPILS